MLQTIKMPRTKEVGNKILIKTKEHAIIIDTENDKIYRDGNRIKTTRLPIGFDVRFKKEQNIDKNHIHFFEFFEEPGNWLKATVGYDGRIFFHYYVHSSKEAFRGRQVWKGSYWHDRKRRQKKWYENDLSVPKKIWQY